MAKSIGVIRLEYNKAIRQAEELERVASELRNLANSDLDGCLGRISTNWTGVNATEYVRKGRKLKQKMLDSATNLTKVARTIRTIAKNTRDADLRAREIALSSGQ